MKRLIGFVSKAPANRLLLECDLAVALAVFFHQARLALLPIVLGKCLRWQRRTERGPSQVRAETCVIGEAP